MNLFDIFGKKKKDVNKAPSNACSSAKEAPLPYSVGDVIDREYRILKILGRGGFGVVYLAESIDQSNFYAIKMLLETGRHETVDDTNFEKEARVGLELGHHPFVVQTHHVRKVKGRTLVVMEFIPASEDGRVTLLDYIKGGPSYTDRQIGNWVVEFCVAMEHAISKGIIAHRDIKPANLLIDTFGFLKVSDFGIAWAMDYIAQDAPNKDIRELQQLHTIDGRKTCGTPGYIAPELLSGDKASAANDIFSFGVTLWQLATHSTEFPYRVEYQGDINRLIFEMHAEQMRGDPIPTGSIFHTIIKKCLHPNPEKRFTDFKELREETKRVLKSAELGAMDFIVNPKMKTSFMQLVNKATSFSVLGNYTNAMLLLDQAIKKNPHSAVAFKARGGVYLHIGNLEEAKRDFESSLKIEPNDLFGQLGLAISLSKQNRAFDALIFLDKIIQKDPEWVRALRCRAEALEQVGRVRDAMTDIQLAYELDQEDPYVCEQYGNILRNTSDHNGAIAKYDEAIKADPLFLDPRLSKANLLMQINTADGKQEFHRASKVFEHDHASLNKLAICMSTSGAAKEAIALFEHLLKIDPKQRATYLCNIGNAYRELSDITQALNYYKLSIQADSSYALAFRRTADCMRAEGQYEPALEMYKRSLSHDTNDYWALEGAGTISLILGNFADGERYLAQAVQHQVAESSAWCNLSMARIQLGNFSDANDATSEAIKMQPDYGKAWLLKSICLKE
ncbi:MAG: protein kinase, partial [Gammaproteobacteria bacterium]|nr:protein kinase [Gammaproteobacteria bacterium]